MHNRNSILKDHEEGEGRKRSKSQESSVLVVYFQDNNEWELLCSAILREEASVKSSIPKIHILELRKSSD